MLIGHRRQLSETIGIGHNTGFLLIHWPNYPPYRDEMSDISDNSVNSNNLHIYALDQNCLIFFH